MQKDKLRKLKRLNVTPGIVNRARNEKYRYFLRCQNLNGYLKVAVFIKKDVCNGIKTPRYEIFINKAGQEWITRELDKKGEEVRWLTAMIANLPEISGIYYYTSLQSKTYVNRDGLQSINLLTIPGYEQRLRGYKGVCRIYQWQEIIREEKIKEKEKAEQAPWDADMALMPTIPKSFEKWMKKAVTETNYIFYEYKKGGAKKGYCRRCECDVVLKKIPHHRDKIKCPRCKSESILISTGKIQVVHSETKDDGQLIQPIPGGFVIRTFSVSYRVETKNYRNPQYSIYEYSRTLIRDNDVASYSHTPYKNKYVRWCKNEELYFGSSAYVGKIYRTNLPKVRSVIDQKSALPLLIQQGKKFSIENYLFEEKKHPVIEMLVKAGMEDLALKYVYDKHNILKRDMLDERQTELVKILKLDQDRLRRMKKIGASIMTLCWLQEEKVRDTIWPDEMIQYFAVGQIGMVRDLDFINDKLSLIKIYHYLQKQEKIACEGPCQLLITWRDYLRMAEKLKMNTNLEMIYKPKNLRAAHDEAIELLERDGMIKLAKETAKKFPRVDKVCKTLKNYEYSDGKFCIKAPEGVLDIVREGTILKHCIHTCDYYFERIESKESFLLFLRRVGQENTPWYTLEIEPGGNIRQKRTTGDDQKPDLNEAIPFLRKWQQYVKKHMDAEEKKLAKVADQKRKENYENLRKNGNQVWHGRLAGQLLADVLEQDFMAVI